MNNNNNCEAKANVLNFILTRTANFFLFFFFFWSRKNFWNCTMKEIMNGEKKGHWQIDWCLRFSILLIKHTFIHLNYLFWQIQGTSMEKAKKTTKTKRSEHCTMYIEILRLSVAASHFGTIARESWTFIQAYKNVSFYTHKLIQYILNTHGSHWGNCIRIDIGIMHINCMNHACIDVYVYATHVRYEMNIAVDCAYGGNHIRCNVCNASAPKPSIPQKTNLVFQRKFCTKSFRTLQKINVSARLTV